MGGAGKGRCCVCLRGCLRDRFLTPFPASENIPKSLILLARSERFELPTLGFEVRCSIQLSYERMSLFKDLVWWPNFLALFWLRSCECIRTAARTKLHLANSFSRRLGYSSGGTPIPSGLPICSRFVLFGPTRLVHAAFPNPGRNRAYAPANPPPAEGHSACSGPLYTRPRRGSCWPGCSPKSMSWPLSAKGRWADVASPNAPRAGSRGKFPLLGRRPG